MSWLAVLEIEVREVPVLEQPAPYQTLACAGGIEQVFPLDDLQRLFGARRQALFVNRRARRQPALQRLVLLIGQPGDGQWHALFWMRTSVPLKLGGHRAHVLAVQAQHDVFRQLGVRRQRGFVPQLQHARHQCRLTALSIEHRIEAFLLPGTFAEGVVKQSGSRRRFSALAVVDRHLACATAHPFATAQIELTSGVVARMASNALLSEYRLDIAAIRDRGLLRNGAPA